MSDSNWASIKGFLLAKAGDCGVTVKDDHQFVEAVLRIARTGSTCQDLPDQFGHWHRIYVAL